MMIYSAPQFYASVRYSYCAEISMIIGVIISNLLLQNWAALCGRVNYIGGDSEFHNLIVKEKGKIETVHSCV